MRASLRNKPSRSRFLVARKLELEDKIDGEGGGGASVQNVEKALSFVREHCDLLRWLYENLRSAEFETLPTLVSVRSCLIL